VYVSRQIAGLLTHARDGEKARLVAGWPLANNVPSL